MSAPNALARYAASLMHDAAEYGVRFHGSCKVYLGSIPGVDLTDPEWVRALDELNAHGLIELRRCDLVQSADAALLARSEYRPTEYPAASFHFLCVA